MREKKRCNQLVFIRREICRECYTHGSGGDPGALGLPPSIFMGLRNSSYGTESVPRAMSWGREGPPLPLVRGEGFRVTATSRGRPSSGMSPPEPGRRAARRLFILRYLTNTKRSVKCMRNAGLCENCFNLNVDICQTHFSSSS